MSFEKLAAFAASVVIAAALSGHPKLMRQVQIAQAKVMWEGRASNWGSPDLLYRGHETSWKNR